MKNIHLLPTDKPSRLHLIENALTITSEYKNSVCDSEVNIYITNDEEILVRDYYISSHEASINQCFDFNKETLNKAYWAKKIILTTDQDLIKDGVQAIPDEFLEWFIKNSSCEDVKFDSTCKCTSCGSSVKSSCDYAYKCNPQIFYKIIIPKEEPKQETLEEVAERISKSHSVYETGQDDFCQGFITGAKWQQERMYSEKDMRLAIKKARDISDGKDCFDAEDISGCTEVCTYSWRFNMSEDSIIEQFKKK